MVKKLQKAGIQRFHVGQIGPTKSIGVEQFLEGKTINLEWCSFCLNNHYDPFVTEILGQKSIFSKNFLQVTF